MQPIVACPYPLRHSGSNSANRKRLPVSYLRDWRVKASPLGEAARQSPNIVSSLGAPLPVALKIRKLLLECGVVQPESLGEGFESTIVLEQ